MSISEKGGGWPQISVGFGGGARGQLLNRNWAGKASNQGRSKNRGLHGSRREGEGSAESKRENRNRKDAGIESGGKSGVLKTTGCLRGEHDLGSDGVNEES